MSTKKLLKAKSPGQRKEIRVFSEAFKKEKVQLIIENKVSVTQISKLYSVTRTAIYKWIHKYSNQQRPIKTVVQLESEEQKTKYYMARVAELERVVGQKQLQIDLYEKLLELLNEELGYDVKKKHEQQLSNGSGDISTNTNTI